MAIFEKVLSALTKAKDVGFLVATNEKTRLVVDVLLLIALGYSIFFN